MSPPEDLLGILKMRREYCRALLALAQRQSTLITEDRTTELIQVLGQKLRVINSITRLNELAAEWTQSGKSLTAEQSVEANLIRAASDEMFEQVRVKEQSGLELLIQRRDAIEHMLAKTRLLDNSQPIRRQTSDASLPMHLDVSR